VDLVQHAAKLRALTPRGKKNENLVCALCVDCPGMRYCLALGQGATVVIRRHKVHTTPRPALGAAARERAGMN